MGFAEVGVHVSGSARHVGAKRELTAAFQFPKDAPFQPDGVDGVRVREGLHKRKEEVAFTHLQGEGALGRCGHEVQGVEDVHVQVREVEFQSVHAGVGEHDGVVLSVAQFLDAGGHVASQRFDAEVGLPEFELVLPPHGRSAHHAAPLNVKGRGEVHGFGAHQHHVFDGPARGHGGDHEPGWRGRFEVFVAVHGEVDVAVEEGLFDFFGEEPLALHLVKADVLNLVSTRLKHHDLHGGAAGLQEVTHVVGLPQRKVAAAGADANVGGGGRHGRKVREPGPARSGLAKLFEHRFFGQLHGQADVLLLEVGDDALHHLTGLCI